MISEIVDVSDNLNYDGDRYAGYPAMGIYKNELYCAWIERNENSINQIVMKKYDGNSWINVSSSLNYDSSKHADHPHLQVYKDELYCVWREIVSTNTQIKMKKYDGINWSEVSNNLNYDPRNSANLPVIQVYKDELYCAWEEYNGTNTQIKVKKYDRNSWTNFSECLNDDKSKTAYYITMEIYEDELYCAWIESAKDNIFRIRIKNYDGTNWTYRSYSSDYDSKYPVMQVYKDELYYVWSEVNENSIWQIKVKKYRGKYSQINVSSSLNFDLNKNAFTPHLQVYKDELYCVWNENDKDNIFQIKIKKYDGTNWVDVSSCLNYKGANSTSNPKLKVYNNELYCIWQEYDENNISQLKIKKYYSTKEKFLIKQNDNYISIKPEFYRNGQYQLLTLEGDTVPNDNDFINSGFENLDDLCKEVLLENNTIKVKSNASDHEGGKIFSFDIDSEFKNINNVE